MCESSGSQFFRTTTRIESGPGFIMTFLTILEPKEILRSFRLVLEWKKGEEMQKITPVGH